jgi:hypothetical protein
LAGPENPKFFLGFFWGCLCTCRKLAGSENTNFFLGFFLREP